MCQCRTTQNYFVRSAEKHFSYTGDDASFLEEHRQELQDLGVSEEEVLKDLRRQRQERLKAPEESLQRVQRIQNEYTPLRPEVYKLDELSYLQDGFRQLVAEMRKPGAKVISGAKERKILEEVRPGIWTFPVFTEAFCDQLECELRNFHDSGLPRTAPNTMNRFGIIMSELGFCEHLLDPLVFEYVNVVATRLLPAFCECLDSYRAFTVLYEAERDGDKELAMHYDNAEVTLNINIGGTWDGGNVVYYGLATSAEGPPMEATLRRGWGVLHAGLELHRATPISQGRRHNLILWCRSSGVRNDLCPMCFKQPIVVPTNRYYHEGFTVPPCDQSSSISRDMSTDDLYD
ncbi:unnamed protein product [Durusdinium trenchii]